MTAPLAAASAVRRPAARPALLGEGDTGPQVRELQARLRQIAWVYGDVDDDFDATLTEAVRGFQEKRRIAVTGVVDQRTLDRLDDMTRQPTSDELANRFPVTSRPTPRSTPAASPAGCCASTSRAARCAGSSTARSAGRWPRASAPSDADPRGHFSVNSKSRDHVSSIYDTSMPFAMFFSDGQAVHYSPDFAARGYAGASHGCVNIRDLPASPGSSTGGVGDRVVVYGAEDPERVRRDVADLSPVGTTCAVGSTDVTRPARQDLPVTRLVARTSAIDPAELPPTCLALLPREDATAWVRRGDGLVAWGTAAVLRSSGPDRFADAADWWRATWRPRWCRRRTPPRHRLVCVSSFGFADDPGDSVLVVPQVVVGRRDGRAWVTVVARVSSPPCPTSARPRRPPPPARSSSPTAR